jgi:ATP-dependent Clp protease ATP-binding subunit ClpA
MRRRPDEPLIPGALEKYSHDLTALARQGRFAPLQRRENEVERVFQVLARPLKNNPALIGENGAERFAIVAEVARRISSGGAPEVTRYRY